tara:strand:+ start:68 stop:451 length:384 start_codon:yes stop_codon:yes gene_type:complete
MTFNKFAQSVEPGTKAKAFELNQICYSCEGCTMVLPTWYKVVKLTKKTVWFQELEDSMLEHDGYGQAGRKIPVDSPKKFRGEPYKVFSKRIKNKLSYCSEDQEYAQGKYYSLIEPWDGLAKTYDSYD